MPDTERRQPRRSPRTERSIPPRSRQSADESSRRSRDGTTADTVEARGPSTDFCVTSSISRTMRYANCLDRHGRGCGWSRMRRLERWRRLERHARLRVAGGRQLLEDDGRRGRCVPAAHDGDRRAERGQQDLHLRERGTGDVHARAGLARSAQRRGLERHDHQRRRGLPALREPERWVQAGREWSHRDRREIRRRGPRRQPAPMARNTRTQMPSTCSIAVRTVGYRSPASPATPGPRPPRP